MTTRKAAEGSEARGSLCRKGGDIMKSLVMCLVFLLAGTFGFLKMTDYVFAARTGISDTGQVTDIPWACESQEPPVLSDSE